MRRGWASVFVLAVGATSFVAVHGEDGKDSSAPRGKEVPETSGAKRKTLAFEGTPADWKARPPESKPFVCDYDLPAAEGDAEGARVNVLLFPLGFDDYRKLIVAHWKTTDGTPIKPEDLKVETFEVNGLEVRVLELEGTHTPGGASPRPGSKLVTAHVRAPGGFYNVWLLGSAKTVDKHRAAYLTWLKTVRLVDVPEAPGQTDAVREVRFVHGAPPHGVPTPWALAGYRIGKHALGRLGLTRERAWESLVTYRAPREARVSSVLDGLQAATGASPGKLNLIHAEVENEEQIEIAIAHKPTGRVLIYTLTKAFRDRIRGVEPAGFPEAAKMLDGLADGDVFTVTDSESKEPGERK